MTISNATLQELAAVTGFTPATLEKALYLLSVLDAINRYPDTQGKLALKGGTALNLFLFDIPRLSVDLDFNYIGAVEREIMVAERDPLIAAVKAICRREGLTHRHERSDHAGVSLEMRYPSVLGNTGNLKIDLIFTMRLPLWPPQRLNSHSLGSAVAREILILDVHELAAGKLAALLSRQTSRDLFDAYELLVQGIPGQIIDRDRLRVAFTVYGGINKRDWRTVSADDVSGAAQDLQIYLLPLLRQQNAAALVSARERTAWADGLAASCTAALGVVLPLADREIAFLNRLLDEGDIEPSLLTDDLDLAERIAQSPALLWKALNVRDFKRGIRRNTKSGVGLDER